MSTRTRVASFAGAAALIFGLAVVTGHLIGPDLQPTASPHGSARTMAMGGGLPGGLASDQNGYSLTLGSSLLSAGPAVPVSFVIAGNDGQPLRSYDVRHDKLLHLIVVRRDFSGYQHVHPSLSGGVWSTSLALTPGTWRLFADFKPRGHDALTLGADVMVPGSFQPTPETIERRSTVVDGYRVSLGGSLIAGKDSALTLSVSTDGGPVTDLDPYLGSYGHLVALRSGDLAYLHVHPNGEPGDGRTPAGPDVVFQAEIPTAGTYHLYFDFKHHGVVRTASFVVTLSTGESSTHKLGSNHESASHH